MRIVLLGPPGAGKGTQGRLLEQRLGVPQISTGDILRATARSDSSLGKEAKSYMDRGELVPDSVIVGIVEERMNDADCADGFLLDGFPRTLPQAQELDRILAASDMSLDAAISLDVPREELIRRLSGRRTCQQCGRMYHVDLSPPQVAGRCDHCEGSLFQREDDREETIRARLEVYREQTAPITEFFRIAGLLREVNGLGEADEVHARILEEIRSAA